MLGPLFTLGVQMGEDSGVILEEEPTISVFFWSVAFVLLMIVTVWFYITQIAPAHSSPARRESRSLEDKEERVAKRILEQLHVIEGTNESFPCEKQVECGASGGAGFEYVDDEIHIHYPKGAWESDGEQMNGSGSTRRRHSMDEMELIFPGFLSVIREEEEEEDDWNDSEGRDLLIDSFHKKTSERAPVDGENKVAKRVPFEATVKKTAVVKPGSHQITTKYATKEVKDAKPRVAKLDDEMTLVKPVDKQWRLEPVKSQRNELSLLHEDNSRTATGASEVALEENRRPAAHARIVENSPPPTTHSSPLAADVEITTSARNTIPPQESNGDESESTPVFTLMICGNKQTSDDYSRSPDPVAKVENVALSNGLHADEHSGINITSENEKDVNNVKHSGNKTERTEAENRYRSDSEPLKISEGLTNNNTEMDYACEMNGTTNGFHDELEADRTPTTHAWTFFSMSETNELSSPEPEHLGPATGGTRSFAKDVPSIVVDSYGDNGGNGEDKILLPATEPKDQSSYTSSFETDIDVDEIDLTDDFDLGEEGEFGLYFKRHVSVTDLDKILSGENSTDANSHNTEGDDITLTNGNDSDDITNELCQDNEVILAAKHDIVIGFEFKSHKYKDIISTRLETGPCDSDEESEISQPELNHENTPCMDRDDEVKSIFDIETQEREPASSLTLYRLDQLIERNQMHSVDLDDDSLETFCEELSDLIDECKKERKSRLFTIPEEVEIADGIFVDRALEKGTIYTPVIKEPKSDSAPIATEEASDSDFDLEESDEIETDKPDEEVNPVENSVNGIEDVTPEREEMCQTTPSEFIDSAVLNFTENCRENKVQQPIIAEVASTVNESELHGEFTFETEVVQPAVAADELCDENENHNAVSNNCVLDCVQAHAYESVEMEDEDVKNAKADVFHEEESQISEVSEIKPTMTVLDAASALCYELAKKDEEEIKQEEICRFEEEEVKTTHIESGNVEVTSKRERGFRITRVTVIKERLENDIPADSEAAVSLSAVPAKSVTDARPVPAKPVADVLPVPAKPVASVLPVTAQVPVTKVTVEQFKDTGGEQKLQSEIQTNNEESPLEKLGLKLIVTGRRTDTQDEVNMDPSRVIESGYIASEGRASPDSGQNSPRRSSLTPAERPRRMLQSTHRIRLTKSHEDLRLVGSYPRDGPRRVIVKEHLVPAEEACVESTPSTPSPTPVIPENGAIESFQSPRIHKAKITVRDTIGNKTRVTILNVRKRVTGNARWKSLNDLDSFGSPLPVTNEASRMSWSGEESSPKGAEMGGARLNNQRFGRVESGYGSLDFERKTPSPPTDGTRSPDYTPKTQPKETIFAVSAEPVTLGRIASIEEETEDSSTEFGDQVLGESRVRVTDLDSALLSAQRLTPKAEQIGSEETSTQNDKGDQDEEATINIRGYEGDSCHLVAYSVPEVAVPLEAVVLPQTSDSQENVITAFPVNDGYEDEELDDVFYENRAPTRSSGSDVATIPRFSNSISEFHSSDADSETSSVHSISLKQRHLQTRSALEASSTRVPRLSDSTDSSHTATPIADLESDPFECFSQSSVLNGKSTLGQSSEVTPRGRHSRSTTEIDKESSEVIASAFSRVRSSRMSSDASRTRPRSELLDEKAASDEDAKKGSKVSPIGFHESDVFTGREYEKQLFRDQAESRKSMPDLSAKSGSTVNNSPYLRGLSSHTKRWLSQNFMSPATFSDEDDTLGSEMFLHPTSFINLADDGDDVSIASVSTRPQSPMSEFSFAGELPYACQQRGTRTVVKCAYTRCGREEVLVGRQKTLYTSCPACFTYYCNRDCRRVHWSEHKKVCFFGRINSYVRSFVYHTEKRENLKFMLSKVASEGYKKNGRGCVMVIFGSPQSARKFMTTGCSFFPSPPSYSSQAQLKAEGVISKHKEVVLQLIKDYDPAEEFVLNLAIIAGKMENLPPEPVPRRKVNTVLQCVKLPLSERLIDSSLRELDTSPETKVLYLPKCSRHEFVNEIEARRHYCRNISKELKQYGIKLKKDYPLVYDKLCKYVEKNHSFEPQSVLGSRAGRAVTCKIMPES